MTQAEAYIALIEEGVPEPEAAGFAGVRPAKYGVWSEKAVGEAFDCEDLQLLKRLYRHERYALGRDLTVEEKIALRRRVKESRPRR